MSVDNTEGSILLPTNTPLDLPAGGSLTLKATNLEILSSISILGGSLSLTAYNYSPFLYAEKQASNEFIGKPAPTINEGLGIIRVGEAVSLSAAGTISDERFTSAIASNNRRALDGGSVSLEGYSILMDASSSVDVSGGVTVSARNKFSKGNGGSISILAGKDPALETSVGGDLTIPDSLQAYSAAKGDTLRFRPHNSS